VNNPLPSTLLCSHIRGEKRFELVLSLERNTRAGSAGNGNSWLSPLFCLPEGRSVAFQAASAITDVAAKERHSWRLHFLWFSAYLLYRLCIAASGPCSLFLPCKRRSVKLIRRVRKGDHIKMSNTVRIISVCILILAAANCAHAQASPVHSTPPIARVVQQAAPPAGAKPTPPSNLTAAFLTSRQVDLTWTASTPSTDGGTISKYQISRCEGDRCTSFTKIADSATTGYSDKDQNLKAETDYTYSIVAIDAKGKASDASTFSVTTTRISCLLFPTRPGCVDFDPGKNANINAFYQTNGSLSFFNQVKSIYNGASGSATVSADLATLNFSNGWQVVVATNLQAGPSGTTTVSSGTVPTLSANGAGQATQNMLYGGTVLAREIYPFVATGGSKLL
jgi:hypothetical protein